jgi:hypothetical protein
MFIYLKWVNKIKTKLSNLTKLQYTRYRLTDTYKNWESRKDAYAMYRIYVNRITRYNK